MSSEAASGNDGDLDLSDEENKCLIVDCITDVKCSDEIKSYFQKEEHGGNGDVVGVIYPFRGDKKQAAVIFKEAKSAQSMCSHPHEKYSVKPARMVFSSVKATVSSRLCAIVDSISYNLEDCIGVKVSRNSGSGRTIEGNLLQFKEAERALEMGSRTVDGTTETPPRLEDRRLPFAQPAAAAAANVVETTSYSGHGMRSIKLPRDFYDFVLKKSRDHYPSLCTVLESADSRIYVSVENPSLELVAAADRELKDLLAQRAAYGAYTKPAVDLHSEWKDGTWHALTSTDSRPCTSLVRQSNLEGTLKSAAVATNKKSFWFHHSEILVCQGDLTELTVDAIVNPANKNLSNGAGASLAIAEAGGYEFDDLCSWHVRNNGSLHLGEAVTLQATGRLKERGIRFVINCVGPQWYQNATDDSCKDELANTVVNCLQQAERNGCTTMAMPAISSGIFGVPMNVCTAAYLDGIVTFLAKSETRHLKQIYLVNINQSTCGSIEKAFSESNRFAKVPTSSSGIAPQLSCHGSDRPAEGNVDRNTDGAPGQESSARRNIWPSWGGLLSAASAAIAATPAVEVVPGGSLGPPGLGFPRANRSSLPMEGSSLPLVLGSPLLGRSVLPAVGRSLSAAGEFGTSLGRLPPSASAAFVWRQHHQQTARWQESTAAAGSGRGAEAAEVAAAAQMAPSIGLKSLSYADVAKPDPVQHAADRGADKDCPICLDTLIAPRNLPCGHVFCSPCLFKQEQLNNAMCPICRKPFGVVRGNQPATGAMHTVKHRKSLPGYAKCGHILIQYSIPNGTQGASHPNPGKPFTGTSRSAYLPDNAEGQLVLNLLTQAFDQGLTFTVGTSHTTGQTDCVVWNDIHHKTNMDGGPENYGYPDPNYLKRVKEELAAKGIR